MGFIRRSVPRHYVPVHPDNVGTNDWLILLEAGTIVGRSPDKVRVAAATLEKKIVTKRNIFFRKSYYLVLQGYDPRIHALYFCPQLYKIGSDNKLVPLEGEEIGTLLARSVREGVVEKCPWYEPLEQVPKGPVVGSVDKSNLDSLVVESSGADVSALPNEQRPSRHESSSIDGRRSDRAKRADAGE